MIHLLKSVISWIIECGRFSSYSLKFDPYQKHDFQDSRVNFLQESKFPKEWQSLLSDSLKSSNFLFFFPHFHRYSNKISKIKFGLCRPFIANENFMQILIDN